MLFLDACIKIWSVSPELQMLQWLATFWKLVIIQRILDSLYYINVNLLHTVDRILIKCFYNWRLGGFINVILYLPVVPTKIYQCIFKPGYVCLPLSLHRSQLNLLVLCHAQHTWKQGMREHKNNNLINTLETLVPSEIWARCLGESGSNYQYQYICLFFLILSLLLICSSYHANKRYLI